MMFKSWQKSLNEEIGVFDLNLCCLEWDGGESFCVC